MKKIVRSSNTDLKKILEFLRRKRFSLLFAIVMLLPVLVLGVFGRNMYMSKISELEQKITSFDECVAAGYMVTVDAYPELCTMAAGQTYVNTKDFIVTDPYGGLIPPVPDEWTNMDSWVEIKDEELNITYKKPQRLSRVVPITSSSKIESIDEYDIRGPGGTCRYMDVERRVMKESFNGGSVWGISNLSAKNDYVCRDAHDVETEIRGVNVDLYVFRSEDTTSYSFLRGDNLVTLQFDYNDYSWITTGVYSPVTVEGGGEEIEKLFDRIASTIEAI